MIEEINAVDAAKLKEQDPEVCFLDVREDMELEICRIDGALHIPMGTIPETFEQLPRSATIVVLCHHGMRSMQVAQFLQAQGFTDLKNLAGGIHAWAHSVDPNMAQY